MLLVLVLHALTFSYVFFLENVPLTLLTVLANNKLKSMAGLKGLSKLRRIDLGANRIRVMDGEELSGLVNLEELWLGKNKIEKIQGLEKVGFAFGFCFGITPSFLVTYCLLTRMYLLWKMFERQK